ncbi:hypothetical protein Rruber_05569 (plasmid) [Rhodococcus ruber]
MNSFAFACVYEGWAADFAQAESMVASGQITLTPAQDVGAVVPLAGVASPSMYMAAVSSSPGVSPRYVPLHEGITHAALFGRRDTDLIAHRKWIDTELADWLSTVLHEPLSLLDILRDSLSAGDDAHSRTLAGSQGLVKALLARTPGALPDRVKSFLAGAPAFALNIWMAMAASLLARVDGIPGSTIVTRAGGNGVRFGIQLSGTPGMWTTVPAPAITGPLDPQYSDAPQLPAIGDSAVIDFLGLGGQTLATAPMVRAGLEGSLPPDAQARAERILRTPLEGLGSRLALTDASMAAAAGRGPLVLLGILDKNGEFGRVGAGVADVPVQIFQSALARMAGDGQEVSTR